MEDILLTNTTAALTVQIAEAVKTILAARAIFQITFTRLCQHTLRYYTGTNRFVASVYYGYYAY